MCAIFELSETHRKLNIMLGNTQRQEALGLGNFESNDRNQSVRLLCNATRLMSVSYKKKSVTAHENVAVFEMELFLWKSNVLFFIFIFSIFLLFQVLSQL